MQIPLQIAARNLDLTTGDQNLIRRRAHKLESFHDRITACRVLVETPERRRREGRAYVVHIDLTLPGGELVVKRRPKPELTAAIQGAFDAAARQLVALKERRQRHLTRRRMAENDVGTG